MSSCRLAGIVSGTGPSTPYWQIWSSGPGVPCLPGHEPWSEQRLAIGGGSTRAPARRPGRRTGPERGLDGGGDELRGLRVDDDVPAEQHAADDLPGVPGGGGGTGGIGLGHTRDCITTVLARRLDTPDLQRLFRRSPGSACPVRGPAGDHVGNRSFDSLTGQVGLAGTTERSLAVGGPP